MYEGTIKPKVGMTWASYKRLIYNKFSLFDQWEDKKSTKFNLLALTGALAMSFIINFE